MSPSSCQHKYFYLKRFKSLWYIFAAARRETEEKGSFFSPGHLISGTIFLGHVFPGEKTGTPFSGTIFSGITFSRDKLFLGYLCPGFLDKEIVSKKFIPVKKCPGKKLSRIPGKKKLSWGKSVPFFVPEISCPGKKVSRFFCPGWAPCDVAKKRERKERCLCFGNLYLAFRYAYILCKIPEAPLQTCRHNNAFICAKTS